MSKINDVISALYDRWSALAVTGGTLDGVTVSDGPPVLPVSVIDLLIIGDLGEENPTQESSFEQTWLDLACTRRQEQGEVVCAVISDSGSTDMRARRNRADAILTACENDLRSDQSLGGIVYSAQLMRGTSYGVQNNAGAASLTPFTVQYWAQA